ncbi:POP1-domain-containing protein [Sistotremastrum niveocremeum HHB9708]|uniref:POP1-domain-containing protein n=1 Tax=Sistotremastrum niveocremeum HHB9708 TaxID=1314777 RepID=A0A164UGN2_9AGAM|nr:POP1-domain-containing protein [Sistotremastrum niveocremeum HHB9708]
MAPKRPAETDEASHKARKKQRVAFARDIAVQAATSGSNQVNSSLPNSPVIDVEKFAQARSFEINAMKTSLDNTSTSGTHRVWQTLPRHLRRRAASHDARRVPLRLRDKAKAEMHPLKAGKDEGKSSKRKKKPSKSKPTHRSFLMRQIDKCWLETHIWHAKRMHMKNIWGYRLAESPTEKSFRPSYRAAMRDCIIHDASYFATIELKGPETLLKDLLRHCCDLQGPGPWSLRYSGGSRCAETHIYAPDMYPLGLISPAEIYWRPPPPSTEKDTDKSRLIWLRVHPAAFEAVFDAVQKCASLVLDQHNGEDQEIEVADLRGQINAFELIGPKSSQIIKGALIPTEGNNSAEFTKFWDSLNNLQSSGSVPRGMIIGLECHDPRLSFPPTKARPTKQADVFGTFPSSSLSQSDIWSEERRGCLVKPRYKKAELDKRREANVTPGTRLRPLRQDDRIPIMLVQKSIGTADSSMHGWTLLIPKGWSMPFFTSLTHTGSRVGGLRERLYQSFESGVRHFPSDYPSTSAYLSYVQEQAAIAEDLEARRPIAKRPPKVIPRERSKETVAWRAIQHIPYSDETLLAADRNSEASNPSKTSWLLRGSELISLLNTLGDSPEPEAALQDRITDIRKSYGVVSESITPLRLDEALVTVRVSMSGRGVPVDLCEIYSIPKGALEQAQAAQEESPDEESTEPRQIVPENLMGYVTSGSYCLSQGHGMLRTLNRTTGSSLSVACGVHRPEVWYNLYE